MSWWPWLRSLALVYLGVLLGLTLLQRTLIFLPSRIGPTEADAAGRALGWQRWTMADGTNTGWIAPAAAPVTARVIVFHGNAGHALHRRHYEDVFRRWSSGWEVRIFEYPGYGDRPGSPSERSILEAALRAVDSTPADQPLYVLGESLGSGVAGLVGAARPDRVAGLALITPLTNMADAAAAHYPMFPVRWMLWDGFDAEAALPAFRGPVGVLVAGRDEVLPARLGRRMFEVVPGPKRLWVQEDARHNTIALGPDEPFWTELRALWEGTSGRGLTGD